MTRFSGTVVAPLDGPARVLAVRGDRVLAEAAVDAADGGFAVTADDPEWLVLRAEPPRIAAVAARPAPALRLRLPTAVPVTLRAADVPPGAWLWLDPVRLAGLPGELAWVLHGRSDGTVSLHVLEVPLVGQRTVWVAPGRYRLGGGVLAVRSWERAVALVGVRERATGRQLPVEDGEVLLDVAGGAELWLEFGA